MLSFLLLTLLMLVAVSADPSFVINQVVKNANANPAQPSSKPSTVIKTTSGLLSGVKKTILGQDINVYYGVPFAAPPVGYLRFKKPVAAQPWEGVYDATTLPNTCLQAARGVFPGFAGEERWIANTPKSEDCLYLNIWAPVKTERRPKKKLSTIVYIYGGAFIEGSATLEMYQADYLSAMENVIVVSMQYRVNVFGFLYLGTEGAPGNMGLWDQALALEWINDNLHAFGGDKNEITLAGVSAGGMSVNFHLLSPITRNLFKRGIMQSGTIADPRIYNAPAISQYIGQTLIDDCGCNATTVGADKVMQCIQNLPAETISANSKFPFMPTYDDEFLPREPKLMIQDGDFKKTEIIIGTVRDEGGIALVYSFGALFNKDNYSETFDRANFLMIMGMMYADKPEAEKQAIIDLYSASVTNDSVTNQNSLMASIGDRSFVCPMNLWGELYAAAGGTVYHFFFTQRSLWSPWGDWLGVMHGDDVEYLLGAVQSGTAFTKYTDEEKAFSQRMMDSFVTFAKTGNPSLPDFYWPEYTKENPRYLELNAANPGVGLGPRADMCEFWNHPNRTA